MVVSAIVADGKLSGRRRAKHQEYLSRRTSMLRTTTIGFASAIALGLSVASPAAAFHGGSGGAMAGHGGGAAIHSGSFARGNTTVGGNFARGNTMVGGNFARGNMMTMRHDRDFARDRDFDRDHDRFRFHRFFPRFAFGFNTFADVDAPVFEGCLSLHRVWTRFGWRLRRVWVCG